MSIEPVHILTIVTSAVLGFAASVSRSIRKAHRLRYALRQSAAAFLLCGFIGSLLLHYVPSMPIYAVCGIAGMFGLAADIALVGVDRVVDAIVDRVVYKVDPTDIEGDNSGMKKWGDE